MTHAQIIAAADRRLTTCLNAGKASTILGALANYREAQQMSLDLNQPAEVRARWELVFLHCREILIKLI